jgi:hypothetical protein
MTEDGGIDGRTPVDLDEVDLLPDERVRQRVPLARDG